MDHEYITPFIASAQNVFSTMMQLDLTPGTPTIKESRGMRHEVSGIITMGGDVIGSVVLTLSEQTALRMVALFTGDEIGVDDPDFADVIGELLNMICGGAKALFPGEIVVLSIPSVVTGTGHAVSQPKDVPCVVIPFASDCGELAIEVCIRAEITATSSADTGAMTA